MTELKPPTPIQREALKKKWLETRGVKESKARSTNGLKFLNRAIPDQWFPASDHVTYYNKDGKPFSVVSQPYGTSNRPIAEAAEFAKKYDLEFEISAWPAWHYPGAVIFIEWRKKGDFR